MSGTSIITKQRPIPKTAGVFNYSCAELVAHDYISKVIIASKCETGKRAKQF